MFNGRGLNKALTNAQQIRGMSVLARVTFKGHVKFLHKS